MPAAIDLSGHWDGMYFYPRSTPPNAFNVNLREHGGLIVGESTERYDGRKGVGGSIAALWSGSRNGTGVTLLKQYDEPIRRHAVHYVGTVRDDGHEIAGTWTIVGAWSGTFIMIRPRANTAALETKIAETVR